MNDERDSGIRPVDPTTEVPPQVVARRRRPIRDLGTDGSDGHSDRPGTGGREPGSRGGSARGRDPRDRPGDEDPQSEVGRPEVGRREVGQAEVVARRVPRNRPVVAVNREARSDGRRNDRGYDDGRYDDGRYDDGRYDDGRYDDGRYDDGRYDDGRYEEERRPRRRGRLRWWKVALPLLVLIVLYPLILGIVGYSSIQRVGPLQHAARPTPGHTVLLVGSDSREGTEFDAVEGKRTDTIIVLHRPAGPGPTVVISIPRDSYVAIPGHGRNKINAAYAFGGPALLVRTVEQATGIGIDSLVQTNLAGFAGIVDAMGGIDICVTQHIKDPHVATEFQPGCQVLNGAQALDYARTRATARADLDRVERQRAVLGAIARKATSPATLLNPFRGIPLAGATGRAIGVDDATGVPGLFQAGLAFRAMSGGQALTLTVPVGATPVVRGVGDVVEWDGPKSKALFDAIRADDTERIRPLAGR